MQELSLKHKGVEKELLAAKRKLGDATIDTSAEEALEAQVATLTAELESLKSDLEKAKERIVDYQNMAKDSEKQLAELTSASTRYKDETTAELEKLRASERSKNEVVAELTNDLMSHRAEKEQAVNELKAKIDSLALQLDNSQKDAANAIARVESLTAEMKSYQLNATHAQVCLMLFSFY